MSRSRTRCRDAREPHRREGQYVGERNDHHREEHRPRIGLLGPLTSAAIVDALSQPM